MLRNVLAFLFFVLITPFTFAQDGGLDGGELPDIPTGGGVAHYNSSVNNELDQGSSPTQSDLNSDEEVREKVGAAGLPSSIEEVIEILERGNEGVDLQILKLLKESKRSQVEKLLVDMYLETIR